jgi:hypothetical protein
MWMEEYLPLSGNQQTKCDQIRNRILNYQILKYNNDKLKFTEYEEINRLYAGFQHSDDFSC